MTYEIRHDPEDNRFIAEIDDHECQLDYTLDDDVITMTRVFVPPALEGRGIAADITKTALDHAREQNLRVIPSCPYVASWIKRHPEYQDLLGGRELPE
ncbi:MAG: GNAT family N-acetyltransferase [Wenzhouxiangellaceae bacterium]|nr:GNAT family N-acetyltransferase [Wenzhouxiangellaceae bacterium]